MSIEEIIQAVLERIHEKQELALDRIQDKLDRIAETQEKIMAAQDDINAAVTALDSFLTDAARLIAQGNLRLGALTAFNLLPFTEHVETVACFERC